jgi:hypothetical protein
MAQAERFRMEGNAYDGRPVSKWMGEEHEHRAVFVDETTCVGCRHCTYCAPNTFGMVRVGSALSGPPGIMQFPQAWPFPCIGD